MDPSNNNEVEKKFFEYLPRWAWGFLSVFVAFGFVMNTLGLNFAAPLNIIAMAKADAYKAEVLHRKVANEDLNELLRIYGEQHEMLKTYIEQIEINQKRLDQLEAMAHEPNSTKHAH